MRQRIIWVDAVRTVAIFAVVLGHITTPFTPFIYSWHIPLFFFMSGFFLPTDKPLHFVMQENFNRLMKPFFLFGALAIVVEVLKRYFFPYTPFVHSSWSAKEEITGLLYYMNYDHMHTFGFVLWFLPALFWAKTMTVGIIQVIRKKWIQAFIIMSLFLYGLYGSRLPFGISGGCIGLSWLWLGFSLFPYCKKMKVSLWVGAGLFVVACILPYPLVNISQYQMSDTWYSLPFSFLVISSIIIIMKGLVNKVVSFWEFWGPNVFSVLIIHPYTNALAAILLSTIAPRMWILNFTVSIAMIWGVLSVQKMVWKKQ